MAIMEPDASGCPPSICYETASVGTGLQRSRAGPETSMRWQCLRYPKCLEGHRSAWTDPEVNDMAKTTIKIEGMMCEGCVKSVKESLEKVPGVRSVEVNLKKGTAVVQQDGVADEALIKAVVDAGFRGTVKHGLFR